VARAAHQLIDAQPLIFPDPLALRIIGVAGARLLEENMPSYRLDGLLRARSSITVRSRFTEEELARDVAAGTRQYVILGAGLDTFAYRRADLRETLTVYEVDQPGTQRWKLERLAEAAIAIPANVRYVPVDFNERTLAQGLAEEGFRRDLPTLFSWLGVMYYLPLDSILETLRFVAGQEAPSTIVFDFAVAQSAVAPEHQRLMRDFLAFNRTAPESWQTWFAPEEMKATLRDCGFRNIVHLDWAAIERRYLAGRTDGLLTSPLVGLVAART
jgi:methyltransferase (TIGR00027 family)